ncbi:hypothetical protein KIN20_035689 [Parelaphostrongylus tenuis]|uniref:Secreted protein n=1 Tax=Parelaphostrongylus tenuis TaxID=148309 RepID=A0AAD5REZ5_PARTN|nr:hypothetical protein KIN20_035689 [Parelaphostrongylus tenuis]
MPILPNRPLVIFVLAIPKVIGCGVIPPRQTSTRNFTVTSFNLPINMVYCTNATVRTKAFGIAATRDAVQSFVSRLIMQTASFVLSHTIQLLPHTHKRIRIGARLALHFTLPLFPSVEFRFQEDNIITE